MTKEKQETFIKMERVMFMTGGKRTIVGESYKVVKEPNPEAMEMSVEDADMAKKAGYGK